MLPIWEINGRIRKLCCLLQSNKNVCKRIYFRNSCWFTMSWENKIWCSSYIIVFTLQMWSKLYVIIEFNEQDVYHPNSCWIYDAYLLGWRFVLRLLIRCSLYIIMLMSHISSKCYVINKLCVQDVELLNWCCIYNVSFWNNAICWGYFIVCSLNLIMLSWHEL